MKILKNILRKSAYAVMAAVAIMTATGCSSDEEHLLDKYFDIPAKIDVEYGEEFEVFQFKGDDDMMVIPSAVGNMSYEIVDKSIVSYDKYTGTFKAVGLGSTTIELYNADEELVRSIPVTVTLNLPLVDEVNVKYGEKFSVFNGDIENEAVLSKLNLKSGDESIVSRDRYSNDNTFKAVGLGETTIEIYVGSVLFRSIPVTVTPQATVSIMSGQIRKISDIIDNASGSFSSSDSKVVYCSGNQILALKAGTAYVRGNNTCIVVNVNAGSLTNLFPSFASFPYNATEGSVDSFMAGYECKYATESIYSNDGRTYYVKGYSPFGNCDSVDFFMEKVSASWVTPSFKFAVIMTGKSSDEVLAYLCNTYEPVIKSNVEGFIQYFYAGDRMQYYKIYPEDGDWNKLKIKN